MNLFDNNTVQKKHLQNSTYSKHRPCLSEFIGNQARLTVAANGHVFAVDVLTLTCTSVLLRGKGAKLCILPRGYK